MFRSILTGFLDLIYPHQCYLCQTPLESRLPTDILCPECLNKITLNYPPFCPCCSRHIGKHLEKPRCHSCSHLNPSFDFAWGCCLYQEPLRSLIHDFKYKKKVLLRQLFLQLIKKFILDYELDINQFDRLLPIPIHFSKLRERDYNQSYVLGEVISQSFSIPLLQGNLKKIKPTQSQTALSVKERWTNVEDTFRIKQPQAIFGKNILIVDDLLTTGATASEAAKILKHHGAKTVGVLTLAIVEEER